MNYSFWWKFLMTYMILEWQALRWGYKCFVAPTSSTLGCIGRWTVCSLCIKDGLWGSALREALTCLVSFQGDATTLLLEELVFSNCRRMQSQHILRHYSANLIPPLTCITIILALMYSILIYYLTIVTEFLLVRYSINTDPVYFLLMFQSKIVNSVRKLSSENCNVPSPEIY